MARYHLTDQGPMKCSAQIQCPLQKRAVENGEDPNQIFHYPNKTVALEVYSNKLEKKNADTVHNTLKKSSTSSKSSVIVENLSLGKREQGFVDKGFITGTKVSGHVDLDTLNEESYKDFGFRTWTQKDVILMMDRVTHRKNRLIDHNTYISTAFSKQEMKKMSEEDFGVLNFYTTNSFKTINNPLYKRSAYDKAPEDDISSTHIPEETIFKTGFNSRRPAEPLWEQTNTKKFIRFGVEKMDAALSKGIKQQRVVYRGAMSEMHIQDISTQDIAKWISNERRIGNVVEYDGYASTSYSFYKAGSSYGDVGEFEKPTKMIYEILTPEGVNVTSASQYPGEEEVILPRKQRYVVVGHQKIEKIPHAMGYKAKEGTFHIIQMVAVDENNNILDGTNSRIPESPFSE